MKFLNLGPKKFEIPKPTLTEEIKVVTDPKILAQVSRATTLKEVEERKLVALIQLALYKGWCFGYGLAAIQIGIPIAAAWYWVPGEREEGAGLGEGHLLINPKILEMREQSIHREEGCLSIPKKLINTRRYNWIRYETNGEEKTAEGIEAHIVQHETDHINGILISSREYKDLGADRNAPCPCGSGKKYKKCCLL